MVWAIFVYFYCIVLLFHFSTGSSVKNLNEYVHRTQTRIYHSKHFGGYRVNVCLFLRKFRAWWLFVQHIYSSYIFVVECEIEIKTSAWGKFMTENPWIIHYHITLLVGIFRFAIYSQLCDKTSCISIVICLVHSSSAFVVESETEIKTTV